MRVWRNWLIIYDIEETKSRNKVVKILESYGIRVQKSAFECYVDDDRGSKLLLRLKKCVGQNDSIRVYRANSSCFDIGKNRDVDLYSSRLLII